MKLAFRSQCAIASLFVGLWRIFLRAGADDQRYARSIYGSTNVESSVVLFICGGRLRKWSLRRL